MSKARKSAIVAVAVILICGVYFFALNFHEVEPGRFYRSGQLNSAELSVLLPMYKIKTVINLRGENLNASWYKDEVRAVSENGARLVNVDLVSDQIPKKEEIVKLLDALHDTSGPILIHCLSGADRAGEASVLYEMFVMGKTKDQAMSMLSVQFHHFDYLKPAARYFVDLIQSEDWLRNSYDPCSGQYQFFDVKNVCI